MSDQQWRPAQPYPTPQPQALPADRPWPGYPQGHAQVPYPQQAQAVQPGAGEWAPAAASGGYQPPVAPPPPGPGPRSKRGLILALGVGGLVLLLVVVALLLPGGGGSGSPSAGSGGNAGQLKTLWAVPNQQGRKLTDMSGAWATPSAVIDVRQDGAVAYQLSNGEQLWGWQAPNNLTVCAMAAAVTSGIGVIGYGTGTTLGAGGGCDHLVGIDVSTGKTAWTINLDPQANGSSSTHIMVSNPHIAVSGDTLAVESEDNTLSSYDLATGQLRWRTPDELGNLSDDCNPEGIEAVGGEIYELSTCTTLTGSGGQSLQLQGYPATGSAVPHPSTLSTSGISGGTYVELWAAGNWLFVTTGGATGAGQALAYPVGEGSTSPVSVNLSGYSHDAFGNSLTGQQNNRGFAISGDTLFIEDQMTGNEYGISAVNLKSGQRLWDQKYGGNAELTVVSADGKGVHAVASVQGQGGYQLVTLNPASGDVAKGPSTQDSRFEIDSTNTVLLQSNYLIDVSAMSIGSMPAVVVLSGAAG
jgi:outer membrane protein assembly factor BamB